MTIAFLKNVDAPNFMKLLNHLQCSLNTLPLYLRHEKKWIQGDIGHEKKIQEGKKIRIPNGNIFFKFQKKSFRFRALWFLTGYFTLYFKDHLTLKKKTKGSPSMGKKMIEQFLYFTCNKKVGENRNRYLLNFGGKD